MSREAPVSRKQAFADQVVEQMDAFALVQAKPMFGGFGIYRDGLMFALIANDQLYFKADDQSEGEFTREGLPPFTYESKGKTARLRYHEAPPEVFDDPQRMAWWARLAYDCAVRQRPAAVSAPAREEVMSANPVTVGLARKARMPRTRGVVRRLVRKTPRRRNLRTLTLRYTYTIERTGR